MNNGEVPQVYVEGDHEPIIELEIWDAVQEELGRRETFLQSHGLRKYSRGIEPDPFTYRIFCDECGSVYTKHSRPSEGTCQWQCRNHRINGVLP